MYKITAMADLEAFISDALMEKIAIEKSHENGNASSSPRNKGVDKGNENLDFGEKMFLYFMESYGRVNNTEKEYHKVQIAGLSEAPVNDR